MTKRRPAFYVSQSDTGEVFEQTRDVHDEIGVNVYWPAVPGRPTEREWQDALCGLVARVGREGMPRGSGTNATLVRWLAEEFGRLHKDGEPAESAMKERVALIFQRFDEGQ